MTEQATPKLDEVQADDGHGEATDIVEYYEPDGLGVSMQLHVLSENQNKDLPLSKELTKKMIESLKRMGIINCRIEIADIYDAEDIPHYLLVIEVGDCSNLPSAAGVRIGYEASYEGESFVGSAGVVASLPEGRDVDDTNFAIEMFTIYDRLMAQPKYWADFKTIYDDDGFQPVEISWEREISA